MKETVIDGRMNVGRKGEMKGNGKKEGRKGKGEGEGKAGNLAPRSFYDSQHGSFCQKMLQVMRINS